MHRSDDGDSWAVERLAIVSLLLIATLIAACGEAEETPETAIRAMLERTVEAAEAADIDGVAEALHEDYRDARGNDRRAILGMLRLYLLRQGSLLVIPDIEAIDVYTQDTASLTVTARFAGADFGRMSVETGVYRFELELIHDEGWQVSSARWSRADRMPR